MSETATESKSTAAPAAIQPFTPAEYRLKKGKFTEADIPRLEAMIEILMQVAARNGINAERNKQAADKLCMFLAGLIKRASLPLQPLEVLLSKDTLKKLPPAYDFNFAETQRDFLLKVTPKVIVAGSVPR